MANEYVPYEGSVVTRGEALASGAKWYFNGRPCGSGHLSLRRTTTKRCQGCEGDYLRRLRGATAEKKAAAPLTPRQIAKAEGKKRYFTGIACDAGHIAERFVNCRGCCECAAEQRRKIPREKLAAYARKWREANPEAVKATVRKHNTLHREKRRQQARTAYALNVDVGRARTKRWREKNPEGVRAHAMTRWALKKGSSGSYTAVDVQELCALQKGRCLNCGKALKSKFHVDHIQPLSRGGLNVRSNLQILCPPCNLSKHASDPIEWAQRNGRLL